MDQKSKFQKLPYKIGPKNTKIYCMTSWFGSEIIWQVDMTCSYNHFWDYLKKILQNFEVVDSCLS
jgi:hypothetical protein